MHYVYCGAYRELFFALYLKNLGKKVTIVTYNEDLRKYCSDTNLKYIFFKVLRPELITFYKIFILKRRLKKLIDRIDFKKQDCFYLLHNAVGYDGFYLAKQFSKIGAVYFKRCHKLWKDYEWKFNRDYIDKIIIKYIIKIFLDLDLIFYETNKVPRLGINDEFLRKNNIVKILQKTNFDDLIFGVVKNNKVDQKEYENLVIGESDSVIIDPDSIKIVSQKLLDMSLKFALKEHPNPIKSQLQDKSVFRRIFKNCEEIPDYIPVELYFNNIKKNVIGIMSASLIIASKLKHLRVISLLELVDWYHQSYKKEFKDYLVKKSKNKIIFPISFEELRDILSQG